MAFPTSPSNNQVHKETGTNRTFVYDSAAGVWDQVKEAQSDMSNITGHIGNEVTGFTGIKNCDTWRLHTTFYATTSIQTIGANWERGDARGVTHIGQGMSERNGVFTFPSTGIWSIEGYFRMNGNGGARTYMQGGVHFTDNDESNWYESAWAIESCYTGDAYGTAPLKFIFKVGNTTSYKVKFVAYGSGATRVLGDSTVMYTYFVFQRIADLQGDVWN